MKTERKLLAVLNALPAFEAAARAGSFTKAAVDLGMAQPSVSRFVANLESHIGVSLFSRHHNRVALTEPGKKLYDAIALGFGHIRAVIEEISQPSHGDIVSVGCTHGFAHMWILPRIERLKALLPGAEIRMTTADHVAAFTTDEVDLVVRFGDGQWPDGQAHLLFEEQVFPVCSPTFAARHNLLERTVSPQDLPRLTLLLQDHGEHGWLGWPQWLASFGVNYEPPKDTYLIYNYAFILQAAMEGEGICLAWESLAEPHLANEWLVELPGMRVKTGKGYYLVVSKASFAADAVKTWVHDATSAA